MIKNLKNIKFILYDLKIAKNKYFLFNIFATILSSLNSTINIVFLKLILDHLDSYSDISFLFLILLYSIYLLLNSLIFIFLKDKYNPSNNIKIQLNLQKIIFNKIKTLDVSCYEDPEFYNKYIRALNETENRFFQIIDTINKLIFGLVSTLSIGILIFTLHPIFILFSILLVLITVVQNYLTNKLQYLLDKENTHSQRERNYVKRIFYLEQYVKELKVYPIFKIFIGMYENASNNIIFNTEKKYSKIYLIDMISMLLNISVSLAMIYFICMKVISKEFSISDFMILFTSVNTLSSNLSSVFAIIPNIGLHGLYIDNLLEVLEYKPKIENYNKSTKDLTNRFQNITYEKVYFSYDTKNVLSDININIEAGQKIAIVGRNGSGKSSFMKLLLRLYDPQYGKIEINGINYIELDTSKLRSNFAVMYQNYNLYALTIGENILMEPIVNKEQEEMVWESLKFSGLYEKVKLLKDGINTVITKEFNNDGIYLSGGEQQMLSIARAYASKGSILVFDEPSSSLDVIFEQQLFSKLLMMGQNKTIIFITHKLYSTVDADKIYFFEEGRIIEAGSHKELLGINGKYKNMFESQVKRYNDSYKIN